MKKIILKYFPIAVALVLLITCISLVKSYEGKFTEYCVISYADSNAACDITVSSTGYVIEYTPANKLSNKYLLSHDITGRNVDEVVADLAEAAPENDTVFIGAYYREDSEGEDSVVKDIVTLAASKIPQSKIITHGAYAEKDSIRAMSGEVTVGQSMFIKAFSEVYNIYTSDAYLDEYFLYAADFHDMVIFLQYLSSENEGFTFAEELHLDLSAFKERGSYISLDSAVDYAISGSTNFFGELVENMEYMGLSFEEGKISYFFSCFVGDSTMKTYFNVDMNTGEMRYSYILTDPY